MATKPTSKELGVYADSVFNLSDLVRRGVRPAEETAKRVQAIADNKADPSVPSGLDVFLTPAGFTRQELQLANLRVWNQGWVKLGGFFSEEQIHAAMLASPFYSWEEPSAPVVLRWTANNLVQTTEQTVSALEQVYGDKLYVSPDFRIDTEHLTPVEGAPEFQPNRLWWEVLDVDANRDKAPDAVPPATAGGIEVIQAAAHHPGYTKRMNGDDIAYWDVPGLRVKVPGGSEPYAPCVSGRSDGRLDLGVYWADDPGSDCAEVTVRES